MRFLILAVLLLSPFANARGFATEGKIQKKAEDSSELDCKNDQYFGTQDQCAINAGKSERAAFALEIKKLAKPWGSELLKKIQEFESQIEDFSEKEMQWTLESIHGGGPETVNIAWKKYCADQIRSMEKNPPSSSEAENFKSEDTLLNERYKNVLKVKGDRARPAERVWLQARDKLCAVYVSRFKGLLGEQVLCDAAKFRFTKLRNEDFKQVGELYGAL